jgi:hypothetical protein
MKYLRQSAHEFITVRAPIIAASALVGLIAQMLNLGMPACLLAMVITQVVLFTLQRF